MGDLFLYRSFIFLVLFFSIISNSFAQLGQWSSWYNVNDGYKNGIQLSWKTPTRLTATDWALVKFYNRYSVSARIVLEFTFTTLKGELRSSNVTSNKIKPLSTDESQGNYIAAEPIKSPIQWKVKSLEIEDPEFGWIEVFPTNGLEAKRASKKAAQDKKLQEERDRKQQEQSNRQSASGNRTSSSAGSASGAGNGRSTSSGSGSAAGSAAGSGGSSGGSAGGSGSSSRAGATRVPTVEETTQAVAGMVALGQAMEQSLRGSHFRVGYGNFQMSNNLNKSSKSVQSIVVDLMPRNATEFQYQHIGIGSSDTTLYTIGLNNKIADSKNIGIKIGLGVPLLAKRGNIAYYPFYGDGMAFGKMQFDFKMSNKIILGLGVMKMFAFSENVKENVKFFDGMDIGLKFRL